MSGVDLCAHGNRGDQPCTPCMLAGYIAEAERALWWWDQGAPVHPDHAKQLVMTLTDALKSAVAEYALQVGVRAPSAPREWGVVGDGKGNYGVTGDCVRAVMFSTKADAEKALELVRGVRAPSAPPSGPGGSSRAEDAPLSPALRAIANTALEHGWCEATITADIGRDILALGRQEEPTLREAAQEALIPLAALALDAERAEATGGLQMLAPDVRARVVKCADLLCRALGRREAVPRG